MNKFLRLINYLKRKFSQAEGRHVYTWALFVVAFVGLAPLGRAQGSRAVAIEVTATTSSASPYVTLKWPAVAGATSLNLWVRPKGSTSWGTAIALATTGTSYADTNAQPGIAYEYSLSAPVVGTYTYTAYGSIVAGYNIPLVEGRGNVILLVDNTMTIPLASEISQLQQDLVADGWVVYRHDVPRQTILASSTNTADYAPRLAEVQAVRTLVQNDYNNNGKGNNWALFILGRVPVPYSGAVDPDAVAVHTGAWPTDLYYADVDGTWTDATVVSGTSASADKRNRNVVGDGKFDQSQIPSDVELQCGRVDLANLPDVPTGMSETELLRQYLVRDHRFRRKIAPYDNVARRGIVDDGYGFASGEAYASSGWRTGFSWFGNSAGQMDALDWFTTLPNNPMLLAYGCGGGTYTAISGIGDATIDFNKRDSKAVFNMTFGSYYGDWDSPTDNVLRAPLAGTSTSLGLASVWSGRGYFQLFHMALGETIGYGTRYTQNMTAGTGEWASNRSPFDYSRYIYTALMGDPTLRLHSMAPPTKVTGTSSSSGIALSWLASSDLPATATTIDYWRFEPGNVAGDSGPNNLTLSAVGTAPVSYALPTGSGAGSAFPTTIAQTGAANASAIQGSGAAQAFGATNYYKTVDAPSGLTMTKGITVETFINPTSIGTSRLIVGQGANLTNGSWAFVLKSNGNLIFQYETTAGTWGTGGGMVSFEAIRALVAGHDYYAAVSVDLTSNAASGMVIYLQDLTAKTALETYVNTSTHLTTMYNSSLALTIGAASGGSLAFCGTIDEVRISNVALDVSHLLLTAPLSGYHVYRSTSPSGPFARITGTAASTAVPTGTPLSTTTTTYTDTDPSLVAGSTYTYLVKSVKMETSASGNYANQSLGEPLTLTHLAATPSPMAPTRLSVNRTDAGTCLLTWDDNATDETAYLVERCDPSTGTWTQIASLPANSTTYSDTGAAVGVIIHYRVRAQGASANSAYSNDAADFNLPGIFCDNLYSYVTTKNIGNYLASPVRFSGNAGSVSINYVTSDVHSTAGTDYTGASGTATWAQGVTGIAPLAIPIQNLSGTQPTKIFKVSYSSPTNGLVLSYPLSSYVFVTDTTAQILPSPWATTNFGSPGVGDEGYAEQASGTFGLAVRTVLTVGSTADSARFLYQPANGDCQLTARLKYLSTDVNQNVITGIMIRGGLDTSAVTDALIQKCNTSPTSRATRTSSAGTMGIVATSGTVNNNPFVGSLWMRLTRTGSTVNIAQSPDGVTWTNANSDTTLPNLPTNAYVGFFLSSGTTNYFGPKSFAQYDNVTIYSTPDAVTSVIFPLTQSIQSGQNVLSWGASAAATSYLLERSTVSGSTGFVQIAQPTSNTYTDSNLTPGQIYYYRVKAVNPAYQASAYSPVASSTPYIAAGINGWRYTNFGIESNTGNAADLANPAGDGIPNLMKYAAGLDPLTRAAARPGAVQLQSVSGTNYLTCTFTRLVSGSDVALSVETTNSLTGTWTSIDPLASANQLSVQDNTPVAGVQTITVKDTQPMSASSSRFMRLRVGDANSGTPPTSLTIWPDDSRMTYSDYVSLSFVTSPLNPAAKLARFNRILVQTGYQCDNPGTRIRFRTDASGVQVALYYNELHTSTTARNSLGFYLIDGGTNSLWTFQTVQTSIVRTPEQVVLTMPVPSGGGFHDYEVVLPYGDAVDLQSVSVNASAQFVAPTARPAVRYLAYGDSVTQGFTSSKIGNSWSYMVAQQNNWQLVNMGMAGRSSTAADGTTVGSQNANVISVFMGVNDWQGQIPLATYSANMTAFLNNLRALQPTVHVYLITSLWVGPTWLPTLSIPLESYRATLRSVAAARSDPNLFVIEGPSLIDNSTTYFDSVLVHPNDLGSAMLATRLAPLMTP